MISWCPIEHKEHLRQVFKHLKEADLTLRGKKYHIGLTQVTYLGHVKVSRKTLAIVEWPRPTNVAEVQQFIGLQTLYCKLCSGGSTLASTNAERAMTMAYHACRSLHLFSKSLAVSGFQWELLLSIC